MKVETMIAGLLQARVQIDAFPELMCNSQEFERNTIKGWAGVILGVLCFLLVVVARRRKHLPLFPFGFLGLLFFAFYFVPLPKEDHCGNPFAIWGLLFGFFFLSALGLQVQKKKSRKDPVGS